MDSSDRRGGSRRHIFGKDDQIGLGITHGQPCRQLSIALTDEETNLPGCVMMDVFHESYHILFHTSRQLRDQKLKYLSFYCEPRGPRVLPMGELVFSYGMFAPCGRLLGITGFARGAPSCSKNKWNSSF